MRWNKVLRHWEGLARYDEVAALAAEHGGSVRRVSAPAAAPAPQPAPPAPPAPPPSMMGGLSGKSDAKIDHKSDAAAVS
jgi:hypothetical protein